MSAVTRVQSLPDPSKKEAYETSYNKGVAKMKSSEWEGAINYFNTAIDCKKDEPTAFYNRALAQVKWIESRKAPEERIQDLYKKAIHDYTQAIQLDPNFMQPRNGRGVVYMHQKRFEEALREFEEAIKLDPKNAKVRVNWGLVALELGLPEKALEAFRAARTMDSLLVEAWINEGCALHELKLYNEALAAYDQALTISPNHPVALSNREKVLTADLK